MTDHPKQLLGMRLVLLARRWRQHLDERLSETGISDATWAPLLHLYRAGKWLHHKDLAARVGLDVSSLVRLLDKLEVQGLIERQPDPEDRRAKRLFLTPDGMVRVEEIAGLIARLEEDLLQDLDDTSAQKVLEVFEAIDNRLEKGKT